MGKGCSRFVPEEAFAAQEMQLEEKKNDSSVWVTSSV